MIKLKLGNKVPRPDAQPSQDRAPSSAASLAQPAPAVQPAPIKLKLNVSQPPTPIDQPSQAAIPLALDASTDKKKRTYNRKQDGSSKSKKRAADDDTLPPAAKRAASGANPIRKFSLKPPAQIPEATPKITSQGAKRKSSAPKLTNLIARGRAPPRPKGVGYDSEDSDVEKDPAIQQALVLRMEDGEDATYLREAIANGKIGEPSNQGGADVTIKFLEKNLRRAVIKIRGNTYAAVLVDLPCIVESMKSFDKKGWWKVADIAQMLLVLGRCNGEEEAKTFQLPREVNKDNFQYAHGLTPPMRWVRKRRFRKRLNQTEATDIDEQVAKLIAADKEWESNGGTVTVKKQREHEPSVEPQGYEDDDDDAEGEAVETVEMDGQEYDEDDEDVVDEGDDDLEAQLGLALDEDDEPVSELIAESPAPMADQAASMAAVEHAIQDDSEATPVGTPAEEIAMTPQQQSSDEDESDEDDDDPDEYDEDAAARAAERAQQMEEVADLEREVERGRQRMQAMNNQLLRQREAQKLVALEEELTAKKRALGLEEAD